MADTITHPDARIAKLEELFASLPGLGPRSAARLVSDLLTSRRAEARAIKDGLEETLTGVRLLFGRYTRQYSPVCGGKRGRSKGARSKSFLSRGLFRVDGTH